ncbi:MAG: LysM peptidoglycan-binding domain-containing protein [Bacteroidia bacterium]|nr:LysM peptidoglycan-binding domain-containing protein [Bacteroidia bacterium]MDW8236283.1 LysM peptidoglycan-binding domain-containing protein [Bacteroidia bacterium]
MVEAAGSTDAGKVRTQNQDYFIEGAVPHGYVGIVCDGMGGEEAGDIAARIVAETIFNHLQTVSPTDSPLEALRTALEKANEALLEHIRQNPHLKRIGSTAVVALIHKGTCYYGHVGDSRLYLWNGKELHLLTRDDSLVNQLLDAGMISETQALQHPQRHVLVQALGQEPPPQPHLHQIALPRKSLLLLCTDGISNLLSQEDIILVLSNPDTNLKEKAHHLVEKANQLGGYDNATVLLLRPLRKSPTFVLNMNFKLPPTRYLLTGGIGLVVLILIFVIFSRRSTASPAEEKDVIVLQDDTTSASGTFSESAVDSSMNYPGGGVISPPPIEEVPPSPAPAPSPSTPPKPKANVSTNERREYLSYAIQKGDNLKKIAEVFHTTVSELRRVNNLKDDNIQAGKKLKIPVIAVHEHEVRAKETISSLARQYRSTQEAIKKANHLDDDKIRKGQKLIIPILR